MDAGRARWRRLTGMIIAVAQDVGWSNKRRKFLLAVAAVAVGLVGLAYGRYLPSRERARARISTGSAIAATGCGPIEYAVRR